MRKTAAMTALLISTVLAVTGCTPSERPSDLPEGGAGSSQAASSAAAPTSTTPAGPPCTIDQVTATGAAGQKPTVTIPATCSPPAELLTKDLIPGTGAAIKTGDQLQMHYALYTWSTKKENQASFGDAPFSATLAKGQLIDGWVEGLVGMKQGGRRLLVVPPAKGYKEKGTSDGSIKGNETLVFVVDAVKVGA
ncbi:FKBP-type peptidyl-prolyl cis-trans isomerase [Allokutzneria sp. A3M-2-11 16]|uniref:FKBP-type peptidyl-prolyl cis-trans isomerase n=1 Tax=Allokutzneria sp. A3M-2-11 16 TaxID=2962043 RepID=UPI0020B67A35|nr:FKBP-type peptidyl-prolyl cis-trans isomerase [Allokutzneria sp. A3M-2-11 16]MCP3803542.1 FKBP-type peptidyl-prolyl cis-trans isomerase [Allokutzneria sp. A3M-2-11 16]